MLDLPWDANRHNDNFDLHHAQTTLDEDHYGLEKVKERIIEHLAVLKIKGRPKSADYLSLRPSWVWERPLVRKERRQSTRTENTSE